MNLELVAMRWLWLEKKCHYVLEERCIRWQAGKPDVIGITAGRYLTEIEIKRSVSDFRADARKPHRENRSHYLPEQPRQFYYLIPLELLDKIMPLIPEWAGLMTVKEGFYKAEIQKVSPVNRESRKLSLKECVKVARLMTNHMMTYAISFDTHQQMSRRDDLRFVEWEPCENGTWQI